MKMTLFFLALLHPMLTYPLNLDSGNIQRTNTVIIGNVEGLEEQSTVELIVYKDISYDNASYMETHHTTKVNKGRFRLEFPLEGYAYISLRYYADETRKLNGYLIEQGDSIVIQGRGNSPTFSGEGAEKMKAMQELRIVYSMFGAEYQLGYQNSSSIATYFSLRDSLYGVAMKKLADFNDILDTPVLESLQMDALLFKNASPALYMKYCKDTVGLINSIAEYHGNPIYMDREFENLARASVPPFTLTNYLFQKYNYEQCYLAKMDFSLGSSYSYYKRLLDGRIREQMITYLLYKTRNVGGDWFSHIDDALSQVSDKQLHEFLTDLKSSNTIGVPAFPFELPDTEDNVRALTDFRGHVVVLDFWFTGCLACAAQRDILASVEESVNGLPVKFISISIDTKKSVWLKSVASGMYTTPEAINLHAQGTSLWNHPILQQYNVNSCPTIIVIDMEGNLLRRPVYPPSRDGGSDLSKLINSTLN